MDAIFERPFMGRGVIESLFGDLFADQPVLSDTHPTGTSTLTVDVPGVKREDLSIEVLGRALTIRGKRGGREFTNTYRMQSWVDEANIEAALADGVLTMTFHAKESAVPKARRVEIR